MLGITASSADLRCTQLSLVVGHPEVQVGRAGQEQYPRGDRAERPRQVAAVQFVRADVRLLPGESLRVEVRGAVRAELLLPVGAQEAGQVGRAERRLVQPLAVEVLAQPPARRRCARTRAARRPAPRRTARSPGTRARPPACAAARTGTPGCAPRSARCRRRRSRAAPGRGRGPPSGRPVRRPSRTRTPRRPWSRRGGSASSAVLGPHVVGHRDQGGIVRRCRRHRRTGRWRTCPGMTMNHRVGSSTPSGPISQDRSSWFAV